MTQTSIEHSLVSSYLLAQGFGQGPDFVVCTRAMEVDPQAEEGRPILRMIGSSTEKDLQGDTMMITALQDMTKAPINLTVFMNHKYDLPNDVFGGLAEKPAIVQQNGIADLHLKVEVEMENPAAVRTYTMITKSKRRFGCSTGCQVTAFTFDEDSDAAPGAIFIHHIRQLEWSTVGIPASQRSWVENAVYGLFARSLVEGRADDVLKLAPAVKGMYSRDYEKIVRNVEVKSLQRDLERTPSRSTHPQRIFYDFTQDSFALGDRTGVLKSIGRDELGNLLTSGAPLHKQTPVPSVPSLKSEKDIVDSDSGGALDRQDLDEHPKGQAKVTIHKDGSHEDFTGTHTHLHKAYGAQGDDEMHTHEHTHEGDSNHDHHTASEKAGEPEKVADMTEVVADSAITTTEQANEIATEMIDGIEKSVQTTIEPVVLVEATDTTKGVDTVVVNAETDHPFNVTFTQANGFQVDTVVVNAETDYQRLALLSVYNDIGTKLGFSPASLDAQKAMGDGGSNMQGVVTMLSQLDDLMDTAASSSGAVQQASMIVDALLASFGIPDIDVPGEQDTQTPLLFPAFPSDTYSLDIQLEKAVRGLTIIKEGRTLNADNKSKLQQAHDLIKAVHPGCCTSEENPMNTDSTANTGSGMSLEDASRDANFQQGTMTASLLPGMEYLAKALEGFNVKSIEQEVQNARKALADANKEIAEIKQTMNVLKNAPLGRPTTLHRSVQGEATYEDMKNAASGTSSAASVTTLKDALAQTEIIKLNGTSYRKWPHGLAKELRPALTSDQKSLMFPAQIIAYQDGEEAYVPSEIDDPAQQMAG